MTYELTYEQIMRLWDDYQGHDDEHEEEFVRCEVCERAMEARVLLRDHVDELVNLLQRYHRALGDLTHSVIQETEIPRPEALQDALKKALAVER